MADRASQKPILLVPKRPEYRKPATAKPSSKPATAKSSSSVPQTTNAETKSPAAETESPAAETESSAAKAESPATVESKPPDSERDWPLGMEVDRDKDGLATGLFCPCPYPFDRSREELQEHFTLVPNFTFSEKNKGGDEGKGKEQENGK